MGKASRTKTERRATGVATTKKKAEGRPWIFLTVVGILVAATVVVIALVAVSGKDGKTQSSTGEQETVDVGSPAPPLSGPDMVAEGNVDITEFSGKPTLVVFWANWCPHCQHELPKIEDLWKESNGRYNVVSVASFQEGKPTQEKYDTAVKFIDAIGLTMPTIDDADDSLATEWGVDGTPKLYVLDANQVITEIPNPAAPKEELQGMLK